ncbi:MAG: formimidoylglutamate deiminase [Gemmatimonadota bacterium]|nr:formimidoylglutamate deiminase [Gemmatimonadota bacterium]
MTQPPTESYRFEHALIRGTWMDDVIVDVGGDGNILGVLDPAPVGPSSPPARRPAPRSIEGWALPGLTNLHSHSFQRGLVGRAEQGGQDSFWRWRDVMYRYLSGLTPEAVEAISAQLHVELLKGGFTSVGEFHYLHHQVGGAPYDDPAELGRRIIAAARDTGIGIVHMPVVYHRAGFDREELDTAQARFAMDAEGLAGHVASLRGEERQGRGAPVALGWGIHSLRACSEAELARALALFDTEPGRPVHIHVAEQTLEVEQCLETRGARPVEWLTDHAPVDHRWCLIHATWTTGEEVSRIAETGSTVGLCPATEANLGDGVFPLSALLEAGGRFGVGTDSHVATSATSELRLLEYGQRLRHAARGVTAPPPETPSGAGVGHGLILHALNGGGRALGMQTGQLAPGMRADILVLDGHHPALAGHGPDSVLDAWVFADNGNPVRDVMVGGEWVVTDGRHRSEEQVARRFRSHV